MTLPRKIRQKAQKERGPLRSPGHLRFVRSFECSIAGKAEHICSGPIEAAHVRTGTDGGLSLKPSDHFTISLCAAAHKRQHQIGETTFEITYGINMKKLAQEFAAASDPLKRLLAKQKRAA